MCFTNHREPRMNGLRGEEIWNNLRNYFLKNNSSFQLQE